MRNGLKYSDTFGYIIALSEALHLEEMASRTKDEGFSMETKSYAQACLAACQSC